MRRRTWAHVCLYAVLPLAAAQGLQAQQQYVVTGRVIDAVTNTAISGAQVTLRGTGAGDLTGTDGIYTIRARLTPGEYFVEATFIGHEGSSGRITLGADSLVRVPDLAMRQTALALEEVVVTGTASPTSRRALGNSVATVSGDRLTQAPAVTITASQACRPPLVSTWVGPCGPNSKPCASSRTWLPPLRRKLSASTRTRRKLSTA